MRSGRRVVVLSSGFYALLEGPGRLKTGVNNLTDNSQRWPTEFTRIFGARVVTIFVIPKGPRELIFDILLMKWPVIVYCVV